MDKFIIFSAISLSLFCPCGAEECSSDHYYKATKGCVQCPPCRSGTERTSNCGHDETGKKTGPRCRPCPLGTYKDTNSAERCKQCKICEDDGKLTKRTCNATSDAICECPRGKYLSKDSYSCLPCSYCEDDNWQQSGQLESECKQQGMARCSCKFNRSGFKTYRQRCQNVASTSTPSSFLAITTSETTSRRRNKTGRSHTRSLKQTQSISQISNLGASLPTGAKANGGAKAQKQANKPAEDILKDPGWIVAFSIVGATFAFVIILVWRNDRIRKKVGGLCCRNYQHLPSDFNSVLLTVEDRQEEPAMVEPLNNATPIPLWQQPVEPMISSTEGKLYYSSSNKDFAENEKLQCACTLASSESSIECLRSPSSSTEAITKDSRHSKNTQTTSIVTLSNAVPLRVASPSHHTSPGITSRRSSSPGATPPCSCSPGVTLPSVTPPCSCSPGVTLASVTPPRTTSPTSLTLLSIAQTRSTDDQENSDQSKAHSSNNLISSKPALFSATCKKLERNDPSEGRTLSLWPGGENSRYSFKERNGSPENEDLEHTCKYDVYREAKTILETGNMTETGTKKQEIIPVPASDEGFDRVVMTTGGNDIEVNGNGRMKNKNTKGSIPSRCEFRPILRDTEHRCPNCCPLPSDSFFTLIERDRRCLREEICRELNKISDTLGNYKQLAICSRVDIETPEFEAHSNPTERLLERLKAKRPSLTLEEFEEMLHKIERLDIADLIKNHHTTCLLCKRNKFD